MSDTPRTDDATWRVLSDGTTERWAKVDACQAIERDLSDALAMLRSVQGYLEAGMCGCLYDGAYLSTCRRCDLLDDVKTTIANCGP